MINMFSQQWAHVILSYFDNFSTQCFTLPNTLSLLQFLFMLQFYNELKESFHFHTFPFDIFKVKIDFQIKNMFGFELHEIH